MSKKAITLLSICLLSFVGTYTVQAQSKEETVKFINDLYKKTYNRLDDYGTRKNVKVESITLDGTTLIKKFSDGSVFKVNLNAARNLKVNTRQDFPNTYYVYSRYYELIYFLEWISNKEDAMKLGNALYDLVSILDSEIEAIKREALKKVETLYKNAYKHTGNDGKKITVESVTLNEDNILIITYSDGRVRKSTITPDYREIGEKNQFGTYSVMGIDTYGSPPHFFYIATKEDAIKIKNAMEILGAILAYR